MQVKFMDWRSDKELEEERLALTYHMNSNLHPQLDVLKRSRMKMLKKLFAQMNQQMTPAKRFFAAPRYGAQDQELEHHPFVRDLLLGWPEQQRKAKALLDLEPMKELNVDVVDTPELYLLSENGQSGQLELFYFYPEAVLPQVERVKEVAPEVWGNLFDLSQLKGGFTGAVFVTANINRSIKCLGERGYRYSLLEGGRLTERLLVWSHEKGWELNPLMAFYDSEANRLLEIDGQYEVVLSCLLLS